MKIEDRQYYNFKILDELEDLLVKEPEIRFIQALWALNIINSENSSIEDRFYEEPNDTWKKVKKKIEEKILK